MEKINACLHCGGEAEAKREERSGGGYTDGYDVHYIQCTRCSIRTGNYIAGIEPAISVWNKTNKPKDDLMKGVLVLWTPISIDLDADRDRIKTPRLFNAKQRKVLLKAIDLFEEGNLEEMITLCQCDESKKLFEYPVWEYLDGTYHRIIRNMSMGQVYKRRENI